METGCDLFLSFRGEVRDNFARDLFRAFVDAGYKPFMDKEDVRGGDEFPPKILEAIGNCKSAIVIFSKDYTSSEWCLNELVLLLERRRATPATFFILPILYLLSVDDVKPGFCEEIVKNYKDKKYKDGVDDQQIEKWREAIFEIGRTVFERYTEGTLVTHFAKDIVKSVQDKIEDMRTKRANTSKRPTKEQPSVVKPAPKGLQPSAILKPHKREEGNSWQTSSSNYSERKEEEEKSGFSFTYKYYSPCKPAERTVYSKSKEKGGYL